MIDFKVIYAVKKSEKKSKYFIEDCIPYLINEKTNFIKINERISKFYFNFFCNILHFFLHFIQLLHWVVLELSSSPT